MWRATCSEGGYAGLKLLLASSANLSEGNP